MSGWEQEQTPGEAPSPLGGAPWARPTGAGPWAAPPPPTDPWAPPPGGPFSAPAAVRPRKVWAVPAGLSVVVGSVALAIELALRSFLLDVRHDPDRPVHDGMADGAVFFGGALLLVLVGVGAVSAVVGLTGTSPPTWRRAVRAVATTGMVLAGAVVALVFVPLEWGLA